MKRTILFILVILMVAFGNAFAGGPQISDVKTDDASIMVGAGQVSGMFIVTDGANAVTVTLYDSAGAYVSSRKLTPDFVIAATATPYTLDFKKDECRFTKGLYVDVTTAGTVSYVVYAIKD